MAGTSTAAGHTLTAAQMASRRAGWSYDWLLAISGLTYVLAVAFFRWARLISIADARMGWPARTQPRPQCLD